MHILGQHPMSTLAVQIQSVWQSTQTAVYRRWSEARHWAYLYRRCWRILCSGRTRQRRSIYTEVCTARAGCQWVWTEEWCSECYQPLQVSLENKLMILAIEWLLTIIRIDKMLVDPFSCYSLYLLYCIVYVYMCWVVGKSLVLSACSLQKGWIFDPKNQNVIII